MAGCFVEGGAIGVWGITLPVIEDAPLSLTFPFRGFGLFRRAFHFFGQLLPLFPRVTTGEETEREHQDDGQRAFPHPLLLIAPSLIILSGYLCGSAAAKTWAIRVCASSWICRRWAASRKLSA